MSTNNTHPTHPLLILIGLAVIGIFGVQILIACSVLNALYDFLTRLDEQQTPSSAVANLHVNNPSHKSDESSSSKVANDTPNASLQDIEKGLMASIESLQAQCDQHEHVLVDLKDKKAELTEDLEMLQLEHSKTMECLQWDEQVARDRLSTLVAEHDSKLADFNMKKEQLEDAIHKLTDDQHHHEEKRSRKEKHRKSRQQKAKKARSLGQDNQATTTAEDVTTEGPPKIPVADPQPVETPESSSPSPATTPTSGSESAHGESSRTSDTSWKSRDQMTPGEIKWRRNQDRYDRRKAKPALARVQANMRKIMQDPSAKHKCRGELMQLLVLRSDDRDLDRMVRLRSVESVAHEAYKELHVDDEIIVVETDDQTAGVNDDDDDVVSDSDKENVSFRVDQAKTKPPMVVAYDAFSDSDDYYRGYSWADEVEEEEAKWQTGNL